MKLRSSKERSVVLNGGNGVGSDPSCKEIYPRYNTRSLSKHMDGSHAGLKSPFKSARMAGCDHHATGIKRQAKDSLPPLPPNSASKRRSNKGTLDSVPVQSGASGSGAVSALTTFLSGGISTPPSDCQSGGDNVSDSVHIEHREDTVDSSMVEACLGETVDCFNRSPSATDVTVASSNCCQAPGSVVKCEEQLDFDEDEVRGLLSSAGGSSGMMVESLPQWAENAHVTPQRNVVVCNPGFSGGPTASSASDSKHAAQPCGIYEEDIFRNLRQEEMSRQTMWGYLESNQTCLLADHRRIMVNWLVEFAEEFNLEPETLFLCVTILDRFLLHGPAVKKTGLQLLGTACMLIAVKFQECHPPNMIQSCCLAAEGTFTQEQVIRMEALILRTIKYCCAIPTTYTFLWHHLKDVSPDGRLSKLCEYYASLSLTIYALLKYYPSSVSAAAVLLGGLLLGRDPKSHLLQMRCDYSLDDLQPIVQVLIEVHKDTDGNTQLGAIKRKYLDEHNLTSMLLPSIASAVGP